MKTCDIQTHRQVMLEMLREIDRICTKHTIAYLLFAGSALGAVRHGGFIPWDDDLDIVMLREDYARFLSVAPAELNKIYYLQAEYSAHWPMFFTKLRKNGTACMERTIPKDRHQHQGIYVDIFPADNLSDCPLKAWVQFACAKAVIAKSLYARGYLTNSLLKKLFMQLCRPLPLKRLHRFVVAGGSAHSIRVHTFFGASRSFRKSVFPRSWFIQTERMPFEDGLFPVSAHCTELLTALYGDYMTPSPPEEREMKVHGVLVDPDHSYEDYLDWQAEQKYTVYTRSIR